MSPSAFPERRALLALLVVLGVFLIALLGTLTQAYFQEAREGILVAPRLNALKLRLLEEPKSEALRGEIREEDLRLRTAYFARRNQFWWAGTFFLVAFAAWVAAARRYFNPRTDIPFPAQEAPRTMSADRKKVPSEQVRTLRMLGLAGLTLSLLLAGLGLYYRPAPLMPPAATAPPAAAVADADAPAGAATATAPPTAAPPPPSVPNWPCFRGPGNLGLAGDGDWPTSFSAVTGANLLWKTALPLSGKSSPIVWDRRIFLTAADAQVQRVVCVDRADGKILWDKQAVPPPGPPLGTVEVFEDTGYAASTPATDGKHVFVIFANGLLAAFDFDGTQVWALNLGVPDSSYSFAASLLCEPGLLIVQLDQGREATDKASKLLGIDPATGKFLYQTPRAVANSWSSPALIPGPGGSELVTCAPEWVIAYDPKTGKERWKVQYGQADIAPSPAYGGGLVFVTNDGVALFAIRPGGTGDVTATHVVWKAEEGMPDTSSPVSDGKFVLQAAGGGRLTCFDAPSGKLLWDTSLDANAPSSPILAGGRVYLASDDGVVHLLQLAAQYAPLGHGEIGEPVFATPAFVDSRIYIRGETHLFAIGHPAP